MLWIGRVGVFLPLLAIVYCHIGSVLRLTRRSPLHRGDTSTICKHSSASSSV